MKFLFISPRFSGGIGGHAAMLAGKLSQSGHYVKKLETTHLPIKNLKNPSFAVLSSLKSIVDRDSYDIVHAFNIPSAYAMKYAKGKKKVLSVHGVFGDQIDSLHSKSVSSIAKSADLTPYTGVSVFSTGIVSVSESAWHAKVIATTITRSDKTIM